MSFPLLVLCVLGGGALFASLFYTKPLRRHRRRITISAIPAQHENIFCCTGMHGIDGWFPVVCAV